MPKEEERRGHIVAAAHLQLLYVNSAVGRIVFGGESSVGRDVHGAKRPWGETFMGRNVLPWGEVSTGRNDRLTHLANPVQNLAAGQRGLTQ